MRTPSANYFLMLVNVTIWIRHSPLWDYLQIIYLVFPVLGLTVGMAHFLGYLLNYIVTHMLHAILFIKNEEQLSPWKRLHALNDISANLLLFVDQCGFLQVTWKYLSDLSYQGLFGEELKSP